MTEKKQNFELTKLLSGFKRPTIAILAGLVSYYLGVDSVLANGIAGLVVERVIATAVFYWKTL